MRKGLKRFIGATGAAALLAMAGGCATTDQLNTIQSTANSALEEARAAKAAADAAKAAAERAQQAADAASSAAASAQSTADEALSCCRDNSDKIDRMFERAMQK